MPAHDPEKWTLFKSYNRQDVVTEQEIAKRLNIYKTTDAEQALWSLDQHMNDNGVRLDVPMVRRIVSYDEQRRAELQQEATELTGLSNPNSLQQLKGWLQDQGMPLTSVTKDTIAAALQLQYIPDNVRRMLEIRQALGKTSVAKYSTMLEAVCKDGRLRGILQFYGANRSGRWAGKLVQTHNLARNTLEDLDLVCTIIALDSGYVCTARIHMDLYVFQVKILILQLIHRIRSCSLICFVHFILIIFHKVSLSSILFNLFYRKRLIGPALQSKGRNRRNIYLVRSNDDSLRIFL